MVTLIAPLLLSYLLGFSRTQNLLYLLWYCEWKKVKDKRMKMLYSTRYRTNSTEEYEREKKIPGKQDGWSKNNA